MTILLNELPDYLQRRADGVLTDPETIAGFERRVPLGSASTPTELLNAALAGVGGLKGLFEGVWRTKPQRVGKVQPVEIGIDGVVALETAADLGLRHPDVTCVGHDGSTELAHVPDLASAATIVIRHADRHLVGAARLRSDWESGFAATTTANLYYSTPGSKRFPPHHDTHHVFAVQLDGEKSWEFWRPNVESPLRGFEWLADRPTGESSLLLTEPGDVLYIPIGWMHEASTPQGFSLHLTLGVQAPRILDVVHRALARLAAEDALLRLPAPMEMHETGAVRWSWDQAFADAVYGYVAQSLRRALIADVSDAGDAAG